MFDLEYSFCICIFYMNMDGDILKRLFDPNSKRSLAHFLFHISRRLLDCLDGYTEIITTQNSAACDHDHLSCLCDYFRRVCCSYCVRVESRTRQEYGSFVHASCYKSKTFLTYTLPVAKSQSATLFEVRKYFTGEFFNGCRKSENAFLNG